MLVSPATLARTPFLCLEHTKLSLLQKMETTTANSRMNSSSFEKHFCSLYFNILFIGFEVPLYVIVSHPYRFSQTFLRCRKSHLHGDVRIGWMELHVLGLFETTQLRESGTTSDALPPKRDMKLQTCIPRDEKAIIDPFRTKLQKQPLLHQRKPKSTVCDYVHPQKFQPTCLASSVQCQRIGGTSQIRSKNLEIGRMALCHPSKRWELLGRETSGGSSFMKTTLIRNTKIDER